MTRGPAPAILFLAEPATALLADPIFREHLAGREHPERPDRFDAVVRGLRQAGPPSRFEGFGLPLLEAQARRLLPAVGHPSILFLHVSKKQKKQLKSQQASAEA